MKNKTMFIEYSQADRGQHFMTVVHIEDGKRSIVGRIHREYDKETKKTKYSARDWSGTEIFKDTKDLSNIKKKFIENGKMLALTIPKYPLRIPQKTKEVQPDIPKRQADLNNFRGRNSRNVKEREEQKRDLKRMENFRDREQEENLAKKENEEKPNREDHSEKEPQEEFNEWDDEITDRLEDAGVFDVQSPYQDVPYPEMTSRDDELDQIRSDSADNEIDNEMDIDI